MSAGSDSPTTAALVELLVRTADPTLRDRLLLETCLHAASATAGSVWRRAEDGAWSARLERGRDDALAPTWIAAALAGPGPLERPGVVLARVVAAGRGLAVALGGTAGGAAAEDVEDLLTAVLLVEAASGDPAPGPQAPLPSGAGAARALEHDVRNAMASLQATHQVLDLLGAELEAEDRARFEDAVERECARAGALLARGLAPREAARAGRPEPFARVVRDVVALEEATLGPTGIRIDLGVEAEAEALSPGLSAEDLARIARNLVANAREALQAGGPRSGARIDVAVERERAGGEPGVVLRVCDAGAELPAVPLHVLFRAGFSHGKAAGSGQGLAAVRELALAAGGAILAERRGDGALFEVWLPVRARG